MAYTTIDKPSEHFSILLYDGNSGTQAITGVGFQPDFSWTKVYNTADAHILVDSVRGDYAVRSNTAAAQYSTGVSWQFDTDGFTMTGTSGELNYSGRSYVVWNWKGANGTASNTDGDFTTTVSANQTAGFSVLTGTSDSAAQKDVGHGLGKIPDVVFARNLASGYNWDVWFRTLGYTSTLQLNDASASPRTGFGSGTFTTTTFSTKDDYSSKGGVNYLYYCFTSIKGYSKISQYTGNGDNGNGPVVYTGFKPAMVMIKRSDTTGNYVIFDNTRSPFNTADNAVSADLNDREYTSADGVVGIDILSNGFKCKDNHTTRNASGGVYQYLAFAENPFVTSTGIPATAR
ncbi:hypothetical protein N8956_00120 [bacterium]|nr:hypothetical protein [bacterium]